MRHIPIIRRAHWRTRPPPPPPPLPPTVAPSTPLRAMIGRALTRIRMRARGAGRRRARACLAAAVGARAEGATDYSTGRALCTLWHRRDPTATGAAGAELEPRRRPGPRVWNNFQRSKSCLVRAHPGRPAMHPTATGWGEELLDRAVRHRPHGPGRSYMSARDRATTPSR